MGIFGYPCTVLGYRQSALGYMGGSPPPVYHSWTYREEEQQVYSYSGSWTFVSETALPLSSTLPGQNSNAIGNLLHIDRSYWYWTVDDGLAVGKKLFVALDITVPVASSPQPLNFYIQSGIISSPTFTNVLSGTNFYTYSTVANGVVYVDTGLTVPALGSSVSLSAVMDNDLVMTYTGSRIFQQWRANPLFYGKA